MGAVAFDTLEFVETLREAGVSEKQAKAFSIVVRKSHEDADLATKQDIAELRYEISDLRKDMQHQIKELGLSLTIKLGAIVVAAASAIPLLFKLLHLS